MKRVYIAGKLNANAVDYIRNVHTMIKVAEDVKRMGFAIYVPCLDLLMGIVSGRYKYEDYAGNSMAWLEVSDAVLILPDSESSKGTQAEIKRAKELGIRIYYSLAKLWEDLKESKL